MPMSSLLESVPDARYLLQAQQDAEALTATILELLNEETVISMDSLIGLMPHYTWNQIFHAVDQLARCSKIVLRRHRFEYMLFSTHFVE